MQGTLDIYTLCWLTVGTGMKLLGTGGNGNHIITAHLQLECGQFDKQAQQRRRAVQLASPVSWHPHASDSLLFFASFTYSSPKASVIYTIIKTTRLSVTVGVADWAWSTHA